MCCCGAGCRSFRNLFAVRRLDHNRLVGTVPDTLADIPALSELCVALNVECVDELVQLS
jgi:hypothetical protein